MNHGLSQPLGSLPLATRFGYGTDSCVSSVARRSAGNDSVGLKVCGTLSEASQSLAEQCDDDVTFAQDEGGCFNVSQIGCAVQRFAWRSYSSVACSSRP